MKGQCKVRDSDKAHAPFLFVGPSQGTEEEVDRQKGHGRSTVFLGLERITVS